MGKVSKESSVDVIIHAYYLRELVFLVRLIRRLQEKNPNQVRCLIYVHTSIEKHLKKVPASWTVVVLSDTRGRNFGSLINKKTLDFLESNVVIHVHTKRSPQAPFPMGWLWFRFLSFFFLSSTKRLDMVSKAVHKRGIFFPRLDLLFSAGSRKQIYPVGLFYWPEKLELSKFEEFESFPAGGMFAIQKNLLRSWIDEVNAAQPLFSDHNEKHWKAEHFLERHIAAFVRNKHPGADNTY